MARLYYAKSKVRDEYPIFFTFDTETEGLGGKLLCCTFSTSFGTDIFLGENAAKEWLNKIFFRAEKPVIHYAHFAQYDWRYIIPELLRMSDAGEIDGLEFSMRTERDIYQIIVKRGKKHYVMRDSYALYPHPLKQFAEKFASAKNQKLHIDFENECFDVNNRSHIEYALHDAASLREALINYNKTYQEIFGVSIGMTAAGTAIKAWQKTLPDGIVINYSTNNENEDFVRSAYYGGIVFLTSNKQHENCKTFDINSSYPFCMENYTYPIGSPKKIDKFQAERHAIYRVIIETPDDLTIPIIPTRGKRGAVEWRRGIFETTITNFELEFALLNNHKLHRIIDGLVWDETISPFSDFVEKCRNIRIEHKGTSFEMVAKLTQNSSYGKFGAKRERVKLVVGMENIPDHAINADQLSEEWDDLFKYDELADDMPCKPEWAVFITAYARLRLISTAYKLGVENVLYGDTDSLTVKASADVSLIDTGDDYGQFKLEKSWRHFRAIAPKTYAGQLDSGKWTGAGKGLPRLKMSQDYYKKLFDEGAVEVEYQTLPGLVTSIKRGFEPAKTATRKSSDIANSQNYYVDENNNVAVKYKHETENIEIPASRKTA